MSQNEQVAKSRAEFIEQTYPALFGAEEMGDSAVTLRPEDLTGILVAYESRLATDGLLKTMEKMEE